jgi:hypothetical protein
VSADAEHESQRPVHRVARAPSPPPLEADDAAAEAWTAASAIPIAWFHPASATHRPRTEARLLYDDDALYLRFRVDDRYVRSVQTALHAPVCTDSCVEFFVRPRDDAGYVNFEMNAGGTLHASYIRDWSRTADGFAAFRYLTPEEAGTITIRSSLPPVVEPEIAEPVVWTLAARIPLETLESCVGPLRPLAGTSWRANFYKCGDRTRHPHWAAWSPVDELNFHLPRCFGVLRFEE